MWSLLTWSDGFSQKSEVPGRVDYESSNGENCQRHTLHRRSRSQNVEEGLRTRRGGSVRRIRRIGSATGAETLFYFPRQKSCVFCTAFHSLETIGDLIMYPRWVECATRRNSGSCVPPFAGSYSDPMKKIHALVFPGFVHGAFGHRTGHQLLRSLQSGPRIPHPGAQ